MGNALEFSLQPLINEQKFSEPPKMGDRENLQNDHQNLKPHKKVKEGFSRLDFPFLLSSRFEGWVD